MKVSEPTAAEATIILRGLSAVYEQSHGVLIDDEALQAAATLSERYLSGRQLPDKAIDVLDTACARVAINLSSPPKQISALTTLRHQCEAEMRQLEREIRIGLRSDTSRLTEVIVQYDETLTELDELEAAWHQQQALVRKLSRCVKGCWKKPTPAAVKTSRYRTLTITSYQRMNPRPSRRARNLKSLLLFVSCS